MRGRVLVIAGSDSGGGAGIQADVKTVTALGGYAATAVAALTAQDTRAVRAVLPVPPDFVRRQVKVVLDDIGADAIKTGMLHSAATIDAVCDELEGRNSSVPVVVDPVLVAKGGEPLLDPEAIPTLKRRLILLASVITPNLPEAEALAGLAIPDPAEMRHAATAMLTLGAQAVLLKGGHLPGDRVIDVLATESGVEVFEDSRIDTTATHGTGCTLASAIATGLAQGLSLSDAVRRARAYVRRALETAPRLGAGHGPLNHAHTVRD